MNMNKDSLLITVKASFWGIMLLSVFTTIVFFIRKPIIDTLFPPYQIIGMDIAVNSNDARYILSLLTLYFIGACIAGFTSGFLIKRWGSKTNSRFWQSLVSGYIVGAFGPFFVLLVISQVSFNMGDVVIISFFSIPSALSGLFGYYLASHRYNQTASN